MNTQTLFRPSRSQRLPCYARCDLGRLISQVRRSRASYQALPRVQHAETRTTVAGECHVSSFIRATNRCFLPQHTHSRAVLLPTAARQFPFRFLPQHPHSPSVVAPLVLIINMSYCERCSRWFKSVKAREQHRDDSNMHHICYSCNKDFASASSLIQHYTQSRRHNYCGTCEEHFDDLDELHEHYDDAHYWCRICNEVRPFQPPFVLPVQTTRCISGTRSYIPFVHVVL